MPRTLLQRLAATNSIHEFTLAALERWRDAADLIAAGRRTGAIYLMGYAAEMVLKAAYFRHLGFGDDQPILFSDLAAAVGKKGISQATTLGSPVTNDYHDIGCWAALLIAYRASKLRPHPLPVRVALSANVVAIQSLWRVTLRYHRNRASRAEADRVRQACAWLVRNRSEL